eukprot:TRINITY_DN3734_c0_g1_i1.p1 TRINITY_DN3734_c0_g1~~TRINITY_DN3734_c0_g1_i1.p1  ORF type:complete len:143 (+),score=17.98 TRINITY_DN3734_c0_g1_i1:523-951(+)
MVHPFWRAAEVYLSNFVDVMTFKSFTNAISEDPSQEINKQSKSIKEWTSSIFTDCHLCQGDSSAIHILRLDDVEREFEDALESLRDRFNLENDDTERLKAERQSFLRKKNRFEALIRALSPLEVKKLKDTYKMDFKAFGYKA